MDEEQWTAEEELTRLKEAASRIAEMDRAILEMFGSGSMGGVYWFPPRLRRRLNGLLDLRVEIFPDKMLRIEREVDANRVRLTPEVEEYVVGLREIDERIERELAALRGKLRTSETTSR